MISGKTTLVPLVGYPTETFKSPLIYNPWFEKHQIDATVVPFGIKPENYADSLRSILSFTNIPGVLVTMPHKVPTLAMMDELSTTAKIVGAVNAVIKRSDGSLFGDMFDGAGFTQGLRRKNFMFEGAKCLVVGSGGVGSAIAAALAAEKIDTLALFDTNTAMVEGLAERLADHYPNLRINLVPNDPSGYDLVVNATPLGMKLDDPLPFDVSKLSKETFVGEVVLKQEITPLLKAAGERGCRYQIGTDMLFEMIPLYLNFFGFGLATPEELRTLAKITYY